MSTTASQTGFIGWILNYGQILLFFAQLIFWVVLGTAAIWAAVVFNRFVNFVTSGGVPAKSAEKSVSVEEFVE